MGENLAPLILSACSYVGGSETIPTKYIASFYSQYQNPQNQYMHLGTNHFPETVNRMMKHLHFLSSVHFAVVVVVASIGFY